MPPQLQLSLLNVPPAMDAIAALPRPQHVILNHIYLQACVPCLCHARDWSIPAVTLLPRKRLCPSSPAALPLCAP